MVSCVLSESITPARVQCAAGMFGQWNDLHCSNSRPFICAKNKGNPPISTPTPPPMPGFCPAGYLTFGNKCFRFHDDKVLQCNLCCEPLAPPGL